MGGGGEGGGGASTPLPLVFDTMAFLMRHSSLSLLIVLLGCENI